MSVIKDYNNELYHYGVLGMKWGVRKGRTQQAYEKASKKLKKLDDKVEKSMRVASKKARQADRIMTKTTASDKKVMKKQREAANAQKQLGKNLNDAKKWFNAMEKTFADTDVKLTSEQKDLGKKYIDRINLRTELKYMRAGLY